VKSPRTLHVRCSTWEQVEVFHTRKLRNGKLLSMKVPFDAQLGAQVTLGLELPNNVVMAIDGVIAKSSPIAGDTKTWIEVELAGFTDEVVARIRGMAEGSGPTEEPIEVAPTPPPRPSISKVSEEDLPVDERQLFQQLTSELRKLRAASVHDVLGVDADADPEIAPRSGRAPSLAGDQPPRRGADDPREPRVRSPARHAGRRWSRHRDALAGQATAGLARRLR
jgi:hypothetical protein